MPIDPSIISDIKQYQAPNLWSMANEAAQLQTAQNQNQLVRLQLAKAQQDQENQNMLNAAYASEDPVAFLKQRGAGALVPSVIEAQSKYQKAQSEAAAAHSQEVDRLIGEVTRYQSAGQAQTKLDSLFSQGKIDQQTHDLYSGVLSSMPYEAAQQRILMDLGTVKDRFDAQMPKPTEVNLGGTVKFVDTNPYSPTYMQEISSYGKTATPGEVLTNQRIIEGRTATAGGKTTVSQEQAGYSVNRLLNAVDQIIASTKAEKGAEKPELKEAIVKGIFPSLAGGVQSGQRQIVDAAQSDMLDALLYLATGAAYNKEQLEGQKKSYLPGYLDKPETVAAKRQRLITQIKNAKTRVGNAWTPEMDQKMEKILSLYESAASTTQTLPAATNERQTKSGVKYTVRENP